MFACGKEGSDVKTDWSQSFATVLCYLPSSLSNADMACLTSSFLPSPERIKHTDNLGNCFQAPCTYMYRPKQARMIKPGEALETRYKNIGEKQHVDVMII